MNWYRICWVRSGVLLGDEYQIEPSGLTAWDVEAHSAADALVQWNVRLSWNGALPKALRVATSVESIDTPSRNQC